MYVYERDGLRVTATTSGPNVIPAGATLSVTRINDDTDPVRFAEIKQLLHNDISVAPLMEFDAYDIGFFSAGKEVEPTGGTVSVTIEDTSTTVTSEQDVQVFHVLEKDGSSSALQSVPAQTATTTQTGTKEVGFTTSSFSAYLVLPSGSNLTYKTISTAAETYTHTSYYNANRALGVAGNFHVVAFNTATLWAHTDGNVLANTLRAYSNFGTNGVANELSYIKNYSIVSSTSASSNAHVLALGSANRVRLTDNNNAFSIQGTKLDSPKTIWQDTNTNTVPFIDLKTVKNEVTTISTALSTKKTANVDASHLSSAPNRTCDTSYLQLTDSDTLGVYNISARDLSNYSYFGIKGFQSGHNGSVIINVDCSSTYGFIELPICEIYVDGNKLNFSEVSSFVNGKVIFNFVNCTATIDTNLMYATLVAPNATINVWQNLNGTIIGDTVNIWAETHRDDFVGTFSYGNNVTVDKVWRGRSGALLTGSDVSALSVTIQLYQTNTSGVKTAYGSPITLNSSTGWSYSWNALPTGYTYSATETQILDGGQDVTNSYAPSYSSSVTESSGSTTTKVTISNQYIYTLPNTGGTGIGLFIVIGICAMGGALGIYLYRRSRRCAVEEVSSSSSTR